MAQRRALLVIAFVLGAVAWGGSVASPACAADTAQVVVRGSGGSVKQTCITLPAGRVDGVQFLRLAGYRVSTRDYGGTLGEAVCSLDGDGTASSDCPSAKGHWHLWLFKDAKWAEAIEGASSTTVEPGDVHGWTWQTPTDVEPPPLPSRQLACTKVAARSTSPDSAQGDRANSVGGAAVAIVVGVAVVAALTLAIRRKSTS